MIPPYSAHRHLSAIANRLPVQASALAALEREVAASFDGRPTVLSHGDLWHGNILYDGQRPSGAIDWDAW